MERKVISEIRSILNIYNRILENKKIIFEQQIFGIDELAYNPVTKSGGELGYGYDRGYRVMNQRWDGHDTHLHVGFTDKNTAMAVIDYANALGLRTAENPYASNSNVGGHTGKSFHYRNFEGEPLVGKGVDITGSHQKIVELILWIEKTYAGNVITPPINSDSNPDVDGVAAALAVAGAYKMAKNALSSKNNNTSSSTTTSSPTSNVGSLSSLGRAQKHSYGGQGEVLF